MCSLSHSLMFSLTTLQSELSSTCDDLVIYVVTTLGTFYFTISTYKICNYGTSIAL